MKKIINKVETKREITKFTSTNKKIKKTNCRQSADEHEGEIICNTIYIHINVGKVNTEGCVDLLQSNLI